MTTNDTSQKQYLDDLTYRLRMREVPGARIGEIVAEVEAHTALTGEPAIEAFGEPKEYAAQWGEPTGPQFNELRFWVPWRIPQVLLSAGGAWLVAQGGMAIGEGEPSLWGVSGVWIALIGAAVYVATTATIFGVKMDRVVDPRTGRYLSPGRSTLLLMFGGMIVFVFVLCVLIGAIPF